jgi:AraC-like DNA-binding protein
MLLNFKDRPSDSPFVERIWHNSSENAGLFTSVALTHWQMCIWKGKGKTTVTLRGPETKATPAFCPPDTDFIGIVFKLGTFMPHLPARNLVDGDLNLPDASGKSFWLYGSAWQFPTFENTETFVDRLVREGLLVLEPVVDAALQNQVIEQSRRSVQRRFQQVVGLPHSNVRQIERARYATTRLQEGASILDVVFEAGYADQAHLTRSLKHFIGYTPAQIARDQAAGQLSYLFKTTLFS